MFSLILGLVAAAPPPQQQVFDTTVAVQADAQVDISNFAGSISVKSWDKNQMRVVAHLSKRDRLAIETRKGGGAQVNVVSAKGVSFTADLEITLPATVSVNLDGTYTDLSTEGMRGEVEAKTIQGEVRVSGGNRRVTLSSVEGSVTGSNLSGKIQVRAVNRGAVLSNVTGSVAVDGVNGPVTLDNVDTDDLEVTTVNGDILFQGPYRIKGTYHFGTHNGTVTLGIPEKAGLTLSVVSYTGSFQTEFPLTGREDGGANRHRKTYVIGDGGAKVDVESFQGDVAVRRPRVGKAEKDD